jgi:hypothetical protein
MIVLQILSIPCVVLLLVAGIFMIGSSGIENGGSTTQDDRALTRVTKPDPTSINAQLFLSLRTRHSTKPYWGRMNQTQDDDTVIDQPGESLKDLSTIKTIG